MAQLIWNQEIVSRNILPCWFYTLEVLGVTPVVYPMVQWGQLDMLEEQNILDIKCI